MVLSNAEKQRAWRERHIRERRAVQRIASILLRRRGGHRKCHLYVTSITFVGSMLR